MAVTPEFIEHLYEVPKRTTKAFGWEATDRPFPRFIFEVPLVTEEGTNLVWRGWRQSKRGLDRHGFKILYAGRYDVRSWDMAAEHRDDRTGLRIRGVGCHKHRYHSELFKHDTYAIPAGEISVMDHDQAVFDFADECAIDIAFGFQASLL